MGGEYHSLPLGSLRSPGHGGLPPVMLSIMPSIVISPVFVGAGGVEAAYAEILKHFEQIILRHASIQEPACRIPASLLMEGRLS